MWADVRPASARSSTTSLRARSPASARSMGAATPPPTQGLLVGGAVSRAEMLPAVFVASVEAVEKVSRNFWSRKWGVVITAHNHHRVAGRGGDTRRTISGIFHVLFACTPSNVRLREAFSLVTFFISVAEAGGALNNLRP